ncbi:MAG: YbaB/EbfC family nucleoid-associated protein [Actinophytocola sp.]|uniref:YbaB/EbfC family nucleoid-associated protein n=1 Tax=Actinophytocola sp. TaxID=1872138 RepID=UPI003C72ED82
MAGKADWQQEVAENAKRYQQLNERVSHLSITEKSRDGMVVVTVSATGVLTGLVLKERWHPVPEPELAGQIMECLERAQAKIPDLVAKVIEETLGDQDASTHLIIADARRSFPEPPPDPMSRAAWRMVEPPPPPKPEPAAVSKVTVPPTKQQQNETTAPTAAGIDDWDGRSVLEDVWNKEER